MRDGFQGGCGRDDEAEVTGKKLTRKFNSPTR